MTSYITLSETSKSYLAYDKLEGTEPGIVFLPGLKSDMEGTKAMALKAYCEEKGRSYLRFDYFGHGKSSGKFEETTIKDWYSSVDIMFKELDLGPQILVGSSLGGWIGLHYAYENPDKVHGFVGIASAVQFTDEIFEGLSDSERVGLSRKGYVELPSDYEDGAYYISAQLLEDGKQFRLFDKEVNYQCPIRLLHGLDDVDVSPSVSRKILNHVNSNDIAMKLVEGADHRFSDDYCQKLIIETIESISSTG